MTRISKLTTAAAGTLLAAGAIISGTGAATAAETPEATEPAATAEAAPHDLAVHYTVSGMKAPGYAGTVAIRVQNVGTERYYDDTFAATSFRVAVKTDKGPEGVDRLITPGYFNGAYTRDLGWDAEEQARIFEVTLSNPVDPGEDQLVATLNFGDGLTKEGRLYNSIEVTQTGRLDGDDTTANDTAVSSHEHTTLDTGGSSDGVF